jgi:hypothetical protein
LKRKNRQELKTLFFPHDSNQDTLFYGYNMTLSGNKKRIRSRTQANFNYAQPNQRYVSWLNSMTLGQVNRDGSWNFKLDMKYTPDNTSGFYRVGASTIVYSNITRSTRQLHSVGSEYDMYEIGQNSYANLYWQLQYNNSKEAAKFKHITTKVSRRQFNKGVEKSYWDLSVSDRRAVSFWSPYTFQQASNFHYVIYTTPSATREDVLRATYSLSSQRLSEKHPVVMSLYFTQNISIFKTKESDLVTSFQLQWPLGTK